MYYDMGMDDVSGPARISIFGKLGVVGSSGKASRQLIDKYLSFVDR
jgi:hypothetical protein